MNPIKFKKIWQKISFFLWGTIIATLLGFSFILIPFTNTIFEEKLTSEAENIVAAIKPSLTSSIITDDYSDFLDFTMNLLPQNRYYEYLVVSKLNGFSLIFVKENWSIDTLKGRWTLSEYPGFKGKISKNEFYEGEIFDYSTKVEFPGIDWGIIHLGLNLVEYNDNKEKIMGFAAILGIGVALVTFLLAILFAKKLAKPINLLTGAANEVAKGNFKVKCTVKTGDEIEILANTFNDMTREIHNSHSILEKKVKDRTETLEKINTAFASEIEFRKKAEEKVKISLDEKITLLQEIHHRVKNNLQIISSLLYLQISKSNNKEVTQVLLDSQNRVKSMALVHEKLYKSVNLAEIEFDEYIRDLTNYITGSYNRREIRVEFNLEKQFLSITSAVPGGLIINELISNVMKYAFPEGRIQNPKLSISLKLDDHKRYTLSIKDNGVGFPEGLDIDVVDSLGLKLVQNLVHQLDGNLEIINSNGVEFVITFVELENNEEI